MLCSLQDKCEKNIEACTQAQEQEPEAAINIKKVFDVSSMQIVTVHVKAFVVGEPEEVRPKNIYTLYMESIKKQECIVGDATGTIRLMIWQEGVGT